MNVRAHIVGVLLGATCLGACGISSHSVDAAALENPTADASDASDAGDVADAGEAADAAPEELPEKELLPNCPASTGSCPAHGEWLWQTLLKASDYGAGARFTAVGGGAVLVASDAGSKVVGGLRPDHAVASWPLPAGYRGVDVIDLEDPTAGVYVLAVAEASEQATLFHVALGQAALASVAGGELPNNADARGVTIDVPSDSQASRPCVYGAGLACFDGASWQQLIPQEAKIQRALLGYALGIAVAVDGSIWIAKRHGEAQKLTAFRKLDEKVSGVLRSVDVGVEQAILITDAGMWRFSPSGKVVSCPGDNGLAAAYLLYDEQVLHSDGRVLKYGKFAGPWCESQTLELGGEILGYSQASCGPEINPRVLTADKLFGLNLCVYL